MIVIAYKNPLDINTREEQTFNEELTISQLIKYFPYINENECTIQINGCPIDPIQYNEWILNKDDYVTIIPKVKATAIAAAIWGVKTGLGVWLTAAAINIGISIGIGYLVQALTPKPKGVSDGDTSSTYGFSQRTQQAEGIKVPRIYGRCLTPGNLINSWTNSGAYKESIQGKIGLGRGPIKGIVEDSIRVNDQLETSYTDFITYERKGTMNQTAIFEQEKIEFRPTTEVKHSDGGTIWTTPDTNFDELEITLAIEGFYTHKSGKTEYQPMEVLIEIKEHGTVSWVELFTGTASCWIKKEYYTISTTGTFIHSLGSGTVTPFNIENGKSYDIRVTKVSNDADELRAKNSLVLYSVKEVYDIAFKHPELAMLGFEGLATDQLNGEINITSVVEGRVVFVYNGTNWVIEYSNNPAWVIIDIICRPVFSGSGTEEDPYVLERYEGVSIERFIPYLESWYNYAQWCDELVDDGEGGTIKRCTFNGVFDQETNVWSAVNQVCVVGRCSVIREGINYNILVDKKWTSSIAGLFSAGNMIPGSYKRTWLSNSEKVNEIEITFLDESRGFTNQTISYINNNIVGKKKTSINGLGITDIGSAYRHAYYQLAKNEVIKSTIEFKTERDALGLERGDVIGIIPPYKSGGNLAGFYSQETGDIVVVDRDITYSGSDSISIRLHSSVTGKDIIETKTIKSISGRYITVNGNFVNTPKVGDLYAYGLTSEVAEKFRIIGITQDQELNHVIQVVEYSDSTYAGDEGTPVIPITGYQSPISNPVPSFFNPLTLNEFERKIDGGSVIKEPNMDIPWRSNLTFVDNYPSAGYISWEATDEENSINMTFEDITYDITPDSSTSKYIYWDEEDPEVFKSTDAFSVSIDRSAGHWLICVNESGTAKPSQSIQSLHAGVLQAGTITADFGQIADATISTAKIQDLAVETLKIKDNAVTVPVSAYTEAGVGAGTVQTVVIETSGSPIFISGSFLVSLDAGATSVVKIKVDGVEIYSANVYTPFATTIPFSTSVSSIPDADEHTITLAASSGTIYNRSLFCMEVKK